MLSIRFALADSVAEGHFRSHVPVFCGIQYNHSGDLKLRIGEERYDLSGAWAFLTCPGTHFEYELCGDEPHCFRFICMEPESLAPYIEAGLFTAPSPPVRIIHPERFSGSVDEVISLVRSGSPDRLLRAAWRVEDLLLQLREQQAAVSVSPLGAELEKLAETMERHPEKQYDFEKEARKYSVTLRHFRRVFKECRGLPPNRFLIQCRLNKAGRLLIHTREPVGVIGSRVGIDSEFYFSALFKQRFRLSPSAYRKEFSR